MAAFRFADRWQSRIRATMSTAFPIADGGMFDRFVGDLEVRDRELEEHLRIVDDTRLGDYLAAFPTAPRVGQLVTIASTRRTWQWTGTAWVLHSGPRPYVRAGLTGPFAVPAATLTAVNWNAEAVDSDSIHSTSVNSSRLTVPTGMGGLWYFNYTIQYGSAVGLGDRQAFVTVNGTGNRYASTLATMHTANQNVTNAASGFLALNEGDYIESIVYTVQALNINPIGIDYFEMCRIGPA